MFFSTLFTASLCLLSVFAAPMGAIDKSARSVEVVDARALVDVVADVFADVKVFPRQTTDAVPTAVANALSTLKSEVDAALAKIDLADVAALKASVVATILADIKAALVVAIGAVVVVLKRDVPTVDTVAPVLANTIAEIVTFANSLPAGIKTDPVVAPVLVTIDGLLASLVGPLPVSLLAAVAAKLNVLGVFVLLKGLGLAALVNVFAALKLPIIL